MTSHRAPPFCESESWSPPGGLDVAPIVQAILAGYVLAPDGVHGVAHWARVLENGLCLAAATGADPEVVALFALFHDARRVNDGEDPGHGLRGARLARALHGTLFRLGNARLQLLHDACRLHTDGHRDGAVTLQVCWDADRLDLGRVGVLPDPRRLCTAAARARLDWAHARAVANHRPALLAQQFSFFQVGSCP